MTIRDIANMAGVSSASVSRYFNNGYLSEEKKNAIRRVIEETGYHPSSSQILRTGGARAIGFIVPQFNNPAMSGMMAGIQPLLDQHGYRLLLGCAYGEVHREQEYLESFRTSEVDGIILTGTMFSANYRKALSSVKVPLVIIGQDVPGFSSVYYDDYHAFYDMTELLIKKGKKRLGYLGVTEKDRAIGEYRRKGFLAALKTYGLVECRKNYVISEFSFCDANRKMGELYELEPELDAVVCATDQIAIGARCWIREHKPELVDRILLAGQGDSEVLRVCTPPISTIRYQYEEAGAAAFNRLLELIRDEKAGRSDVPREIMLGYQLIDRNG